MTDFSTMPTQFKLLCMACGLDVNKAPLLLRVPYGTLKKYADGSRTCPGDILDALEAYVRRIDEVASAMRFHPERIAKADLPPILRPAAWRRVMELSATDPGRPKRRRTVK